MVRIIKSIKINPSRHRSAPVHRVSVRRADHSSPVQTPHGPYLADCVTPGATANSGHEGGAHSGHGHHGLPGELAYAGRKRVRIQQVIHVVYIFADVSDPAANHEPSIRANRNQAEPGKQGGR